MDENGVWKVNRNGEDIAAELKRIFDAERELLPPLFFETVMLGEGLEQELDGLEEQDWRERALRRFFQEAGLDYADYRRRQHQARLRKGLLAAALLLALLGALVLAQPQVMQALRRPLIRLYPNPLASGMARKVTRYEGIRDLEILFQLPLPQQPPDGFRLTNISVESGYPAGPRAGLSYRRESSDPFSAEKADQVSLLIWYLADAPFPFPQRADPEEIEVAGARGWWIKGTSAGPSGQGWRPQGGWVVWEREPLKFALVSTSLTRGELVGIAEQLARQ